MLIIIGISLFAISLMAGIMVGTYDEDALSYKVIVFLVKTSIAIFLAGVIKTFLVYYC